MTPIQYKRPFYQIVESNLIEKSIRQPESNRIEFFSTSRNALLHRPTYSMVTRCYMLHNTYDFTARC